MSDESEDWRWADADGVQNIVDEWELVSSLSSGSLPHYTLVWKPGWDNWLPACRVAELASAIPPGKAEPPTPPKLDESRKEPPSPPVDKYAAYQARDAASRLLGKASRSPTRPPPPPGTAPGLGPQRGRATALTPPPPAARPRAPMPTLVEAPAPPATATLRPPGAVPPPPRAVPAARELQRGPAIATPIPNIPVTSTRREPDAVELSPAELESAPAHELPTMPIATPGPIEVREKPQIVMPPTPPPPVAGADATPAPLPPPPRLPANAPVARAAPSNLWLLFGIGGLALGLVVAVAAIWISSRRPEPTPLPTGASAGAPTAAAPAGPCTLAVPAKKLAPNIHHGIPPYLAADPESGRVVVGFAASQTQAVAIAVDLDTLAFDRKLSETSREPITGVVPLTASGKLRFAVDRESAGLRFARSVDEKPPITIGIADDGFASIAGGGVPRTIWPGGEDQRITEPRVAPVPDVGFAVTFRRGGQTGEVVIGWLAPDGTRKSDLAPIATSRKYLGTPVVGTNDRDVLVAFAARQSNNAYWGLQVATAGHGELPERARPFSIPPGGLGAEAISPAAAGLEGGRWILQWTEGSTGNRQVRLQTLGGDLIPIGDPVTLSPKEANAGQGVVWVRGKKGLSLFLVKVGSGHELWGAALKCP